ANTNANTNANANANANANTNANANAAVQTNTMNASAIANANGNLTVSPKAKRSTGRHFATKSMPDISAIMNVTVKPSDLVLDRKSKLNMGAGAETINKKKNNNDGDDGDDDDDDDGDDEAGATHVNDNQENNKTSLFPELRTLSAPQQLHKRSQSHSLYLPDKFAPSSLPSSFPKRNANTIELDLFPLGRHMSGPLSSLALPGGPLANESNVVVTAATAAAAAAADVNVSFGHRKKGSNMSNFKGFGDIRL
ncbi:hypothetical protein RFI_14939, partial [Reticulomyxa filosa]